MTGLSDIELHIPALRRYALALLRKRDDADDLVQASLLRAIDRIASRRKGGDLRAWLFTIMHNLFVNQWHGQRVRDAVMIHDPAADIAVPPGQHVALELKDTFRRLDRLNDDQRAVLLLIAVEGFNYEEVAEILSIPIGTVMSRLSRARDKLRDADDGRPSLAFRIVK